MQAYFLKYLFILPCILMYVCIYKYIYEEYRDYAIIKTCFSLYYNGLNSFFNIFTKNIIYITSDM